MYTTSETILFVTVWVLIAIGVFFGGRAKIRKTRIAKGSTQQKNPN